MAKRQWKWACVEALAAKEGGGVKCLVTDADGRYLGVKRRATDPNADPKANRDLDLVARFEPRRKIKRYSLEMQRARKRGMLHSFLPNGKKAPEGKLHTVLAPTVAEAHKLFAAALKKQNAPPKSSARAKAVQPKTPPKKAS